ncbi:MAG: hypothetical protein PHP50_00385 [Lachnospiraceae bacterium]|nr:hypothetical protein [Lachnospiraceae bacterium]
MDPKDKITNLDGIYDSSAEGIVEALPIGTLVFRIVGDKTQIITINDRLLQFANLVHAYVETRQQESWNKEELYKAFATDIYAFAIDEDMPIVRKLVEDATADGYAQRVFRLRGTAGEGTKWINAMCSCKHLKD